MSQQVMSWNSQPSDPAASSTAPSATQSNEGWEPVPIASPAPVSTQGADDGWEPVPVPAASQNTSEPSFGDRYLSFISPTEAIQRLKGAGHGIAATAAGAMNLADRITGGNPNTDSQTNPDAFTRTRDWLEQHSQNTGTTPEDKAAQDWGYGGETLLEFLAPEKAGVSMAQWLQDSSKIMSIIEKSPKLVQALKIGAAAIKNGSELTEEERAIIRQYPKIAKTLGIVIPSVESGATQGAQTLVRTGGDTHQAVKDALETGAFVGGTGAVLGVVGRAGKGARKVEELAAKAGNASTKEEVAQSIGNRINQSESALHENYEAGIQDLNDRLGNAEVSAQENPLSEKAKELLQQPDPEDHPTVAQAKNAAGDRLDKKVRDLLESISTGELPAEETGVEEATPPSGIVGPDGRPIQSEPTEPEPTLAPAYKINDLVNLRQTIRKLADSYEYGDVNSRALRSLLNSINPETGEMESAMDDTIERLAEDSNDPEAVTDYRALRANYRDEINLYNEPVIKKLREGKIDDAAKDFVGVTRTGSSLPTAGKVVYNQKVLRGIIGDDGVKQFGKQVLGTILQDSVEDGKFNPARFVATMKRVTSQTKGDLFDANSETSGFKELMKDAKSAADLQYLVRTGVLSGVAIVGGKLGFAHPEGALGVGLGSMLGLLVSEGGGIPKGRELLDYVANNPKVWKMFREVGSPADNPVVQKAVTKGVGGASAVSNANDNADKQGKPKKLTEPAGSNAGTSGSVANDASDDPVVTADRAVQNLPAPIRNAVSTIPYKVVNGQPLKTSAAPQGAVASVDQGAGNNTITINSAKDFQANPTATIGHELTHTWQNSLPPSIQSRIPPDPKDGSAFDISDADKLRKQGKTLVDIPREKAATIVQKYIENPKKYANLKPWVDDMRNIPLSSTMPTAPDAKGLNMTPRPAGLPMGNVAGLYSTLRGSLGERPRPKAQTKKKK